MCMMHNSFFTFCILCALVFQLRSVPSAQMPLGFILRENTVHLAEKQRIEPLQSVCNILMDGGFADSERFSRSSDRAAVFDQVGCKDSGAFIIIIFQSAHSNTVSVFFIYIC